MVKKQCRQETMQTNKQVALTAILPGKLVETESTATHAINKGLDDLLIHRGRECERQNGETDSSNLHLLMCGVSC
jgi:hypothetical protein